MLNEGASDCLLPRTRKGADDVVDSQQSHLPCQPHHHQPPYPNPLDKKWAERVDRCLEQQWKDSQHLLSFAKALKDSGGAVINSDDIVKELSGLGFAMMQKSIDLRQEIVNESYNNDFFDCHIKKPPYHHDYHSQPHSSQFLSNHYNAYGRTTGTGVVNSPRQKCSTSFYLPLSSQLHHHTPSLSKVQTQSSPLDNSPYKVPSEVSCHEYTSYTYRHRQQRTRSDSVSKRQLKSPSDKKIGIPLLSSSPSISNVCGLSLPDDSDIIKDQQRDNNRGKSDILKQHCICNRDSGKLSASAIRCKQCKSDHVDLTFDQDNITTSGNSSAAAPSPDIKDTLLVNNNSLLCDNDEQTAENKGTTTNTSDETLKFPVPHSSPSVDTDDDSTLTPITTMTPPNTTTSTSLIEGAATATAANSLAVHITPSTPSSSSSMVHTMSTKFHFTRSTTSVTATDRNRIMSRSSSSSSSSSSSASLLAAAAAAASPLNHPGNKGNGKSSTRLVQSLLGRKTSLPALFTSYKKDYLLPSSKTNT